MTIVIDFQEDAVVLSDKVVLVVPPLGVVLTELIRVLGDDGTNEGNFASPPVLLCKCHAFIGDFRAQVFEGLIFIFSNSFSDPFPD